MVSFVCSLNSLERLSQKYQENWCQCVPVCLSISLHWVFECFNPAKICRYIPIWTHMFGLSNWAPNFQLIRCRSAPLWPLLMRLLKCWTPKSYHGLSMFNGIIIVLTLTIGISLSSQFSGTKQIWCWDSAEFNKEHLLKPPLCLFWVLGQANWVGRLIKGIDYELGGS